MSNLPPQPRWEAPFPYGFSAAMEGMGSVAAPLFAGFSISIAFLVLGLDEKSLRWPDAALALLVGATAALGACVQFTFRSRLFAVTPSDIEAWWPAADEWQRERMRSEQRHHRREYERWSTRAKHAYNLGLLLFLLGVWVALVPPEPIAGGRWIVLLIGACALAAELTWVIRSMFVEHPIDLPDVQPIPTSTIERG